KVITIDDLGYDKYQERFYIKNVDTLGSESLGFQDISPTWTETIRTQPIAHEPESLDFQDLRPTWTETIRTQPVTHP
ncbi:MAG TPA: hypothetical protein VIY98_03320, partial [Nitrososphaeraceae archaeon]